MNAMGSRNQYFEDSSGNYRVETEFEKQWVGQFFSPGDLWQEPIVQFP